MTNSQIRDDVFSLAWIKRRLYKDGLRCHGVDYANKVYADKEKEYDLSALPVGKLCEVKIAFSLGVLNGNSRRKFDAFFDPEDDLEGVDITLRDRKTWKWYKFQIKYGWTYNQIKDQLAEYEAKKIIPVLFCRKSSRCQFNNPVDMLEYMLQCIKWNQENIEWEIKWNIATQVIFELLGYDFLSKRY